MPKSREDIDYSKPKIGADFPATEEAHFQLITLLHQNRMEFITIGTGIILVFIWCYFVILSITLSKSQENGVAAILGIGLASMSIGITGTFSVEFKRAGFLAKATLGFAVFLTVMYFVAQR